MKFNTEHAGTLLIIYFWSSPYHVRVDEVPDHVKVAVNKRGARRVVRRRKLIAELTNGLLCISLGRRERGRGE